MGKLIDADVFDSILQDAQAECKKNGGNFRFGVLNSVRANLANQPAVDAVPVVHARWIEIEDSWGDCHYQCTECGEEWNLEAGTPVENNMNYCPNCGAKMDGERRDDDAAD